MPQSGTHQRKNEKKSLFSAYCKNKTILCHDRAFLKGSGQPAGPFSPDNAFPPAQCALSQKQPAPKQARGQGFDKRKSLGRGRGKPFFRKVPPPLPNFLPNFPLSRLLLLLLQELQILAGRILAVGNLGGFIGGDAAHVREEGGDVGLVELRLARPLGIVEDGELFVLGSTCFWPGV